MSSPKLSRRWNVKSREFGYGASWGPNTEESIKFKNYVGENFVTSYFRRVRGREVIKLEPLPPFCTSNKKRN